MRNECNIIKDILPLYLEEMGSVDTVSYVEEHLANCVECRSELEAMKVPDAFHMNVDTKPLINLKKKMVAKKIQTIICTAVMVLVIASSAFAALDAPKYYPYSTDLLSITEHTDGSVTLTFNDKVTDYSYFADLNDPFTGVPTYRIEAWSSIWDVHFAKRGAQSTTIKPTDTSSFVIYYMQNNGAEDVKLYGNAYMANDGVMTLPRLALGYYLIMNAMVFGILLTAWFIFRNKFNVRLWLERLLLLPISYTIGHFIVMGFDTTTYSMQRDFLFILFISLMVYCGLLLGYSIYRLRKEIKEISAK